MDPQAAGKHQYTEKEKRRFREDPDYHLKYCVEAEKAIVGGWDMFCRGSQLNVTAKQAMQASMAARLGDREDLKIILFHPGHPDAGVLRQEKVTSKR